MVEGEEAGGHTRLLTGMSLDATTKQACIDHLTPDSPARTTVLAVSLTQSPDAWLRQYREATSALPVRVGLVVAGDSSRSAAAGSSRDEWRLPPTESVSVTTVTDPGDLTALGIKVTDFVNQWATAADTEDGDRLVCCFDSVTVLLQYADLERVFRFLHVLVDRLSQPGVEAHFHLDPTTQDEQAVATLASLFDEVDAPKHRSSPSATESGSS